eukprot:TRINITY_DN2992_c0_g1_i1.p1 TRINITY_DN2992_c0_g1~~TRINITY_DN2992_c0_g1_i1.p1  ORF type:complete len:498 (+),score=110.66 TRINITY_DN2992_c0_g1_i1:55-1494(+)
MAADLADDHERFRRELVQRKRLFFALPSAPVPPAVNLPTLSVLPPSPPSGFGESGRLPSPLLIDDDSTPEPQPLHPDPRLSHDDRHTLSSWSLQSAGVSKEPSGEQCADRRSSAAGRCYDPVPVSGVAGVASEGSSDSGPPPPPPPPVTELRPQTAARERQITPVAHEAVRQPAAPSTPEQQWVCRTPSPRPRPMHSSEVPTPFRAFAPVLLRAVEQLTSRGFRNRRILLVLQRWLCVCDNTGRVKRLLAWHQVVAMGVRAAPPYPEELLLRTDPSSGEPDLFFYLGAGQPPQVTVLADCISSVRRSCVGSSLLGVDLPEAGKLCDISHRTKPPGWQTPEQRLGPEGLAHAITGPASPARGGKLPDSVRIAFISAVGVSGTGAEIVARCGKEETRAAVNVPLEPGAAALTVSGTGSIGLRVVRKKVVGHGFLGEATLHVGVLAMRCRDGELKWSDPQQVQVPLRVGGTITVRFTITPIG